MDLLKSSLNLSNTATELLCDVEKLDYIAGGLLDNLECDNLEGCEKIIINQSILAMAIMFDYISSLTETINQTVQQTDELFNYIKAHNIKADA